jgi:hypothetical protein
LPPQRADEQGNAASLQNKRGEHPGEEGQHCGHPDEMLLLAQRGGTMLSETTEYRITVAGVVLVVATWAAGAYVAPIAAAALLVAGHTLLAALALLAALVCWGLALRFVR